MQRKMMESLLKWKNSHDRKPLLLKGARQTGKTWLMKEFGKNAYRNMVYIDFYNNQQARNIFDGDLKPRRIIEELGFISGETISPGETLVIFDEIQECNRGLNSLKYFCEEAPEYHIMAAGSFPGIALHHDESFPVGKTDNLTLYPMTFSEFLAALNEQQFITAIEECKPRFTALVKNDLSKYLKYYFYVGGMPEAILAFTKEKKLIRYDQYRRRCFNNNCDVPL